jgi:hypothetical protein
VLEDRLYVVPECGLMSNRIPLQLKEANDDYQFFLTQLNLSQAEMDKIVTIEHDLMEMPEEYATEVKPSKIQGVGLFATKNFAKGETVCPSRLNGKRTPGGRFVNHSPKNNVVPVKVGDDIYVVADRDIYKTEELLLNYRDMMFVNFNIKL